MLIRQRKRQTREIELVCNDALSKTEQAAGSNLWRTDCLPLMLVALATFGATRLDLLLVGGLTGPHDVALFEAASKLSLLIAFPMIVCNQIVIRQISPLFSQQKTRELERLLRASCAVATIPSLVAASLVLAFPDFVLSVFFRSEYTAAAGMLRILVVGQLVFVLTGTCGLTLLQCGFTRLVFISVFVAAAVNVVLGICLGSFFGVYGVTVCSAMSVMIANVMNWLFAFRFLGIWTHPSIMSAVLLFRKSQGPHPV